MREKENFTLAHVGVFFVVNWGLLRYLDLL